MNTEASLQSLLQTLQEAVRTSCSPGCTPESREKAEQWILDFKNIPNGLPAYITLIKKCSGDHATSFFILSALGSALLRDWTVIPAEQLLEIRKELFAFLFGALVNRSSAPFVLNETYRVLAVTYKRQWFDRTESAQVLLSLLDALFSCENSATPLSTFISSNARSVEKNLVLHVALGFSTALVTEFSSMKSSALGMSLDFHFRAHRAFEDAVLLKMYTVVCSSLAQLTNSSQQAHVPLQIELLKLMAMILSWTFDEYLSKHKLLLCSQAGVADSGEEVTDVKPGARWREVLTGKNADSMLSSIAALYEGTKDRQHLIRQVLLLYCSVKGSVFSDVAAEIEYLRLLLPRVIALWNQFFRVAKGNLNAADEVLHLCQISGKIVQNFKLELLLSVNEAEQFLKILTDVSVELVTYSRADDFETWASEAFTVCLDIWGTLLSQFEALPTRAIKSSQLIPHIKQFAYRIFEHYVSHHLAYARNEIVTGATNTEQFDEESFLKDQFAAIAYLGRLNGDAFLRSLANEIQTRTSSLSGYAASFSGGDALTVAVIHEELYWLLNIVSYLMCDDCTGETPTIPRLLCQTTLNCEVSDHPFVAAAKAVFSYLEFENQCLLAMNTDTRYSAFVSPIVADCAVLFLTRWVPSYLMPAEGLYDVIVPVLWTSFGEGTAGADYAMKMVLNKILLNIVHWKAEKEVLQRTCQLIGTLVKSRKVVQKLVNYDDWWRVVSLCTKGSATAASITAESLLFLLDADIVRSLVFSICESVGAVSADSVQGKAENLRTVAAPIVEYFARVTSSPNLRSDGQHVLMCLEMFRGISMSDRDVSAVFDVLSPHFRDFITVLDFFASDRALVNCVFHLFEDFAETKMAYLDEAQCAVFFQHCVCAIQKFSAMWPALSQQPRGEDSDEDPFEDLLLVVSILEHIASKDLFSFAADSVSFVSDAVFAGLPALLPLVTVESLEYPLLCRRLFSLLEDTITTYQEAFGRLDANSQECIINLVTFSMNHHQLSVAGEALNVLATLASYYSMAVVNARYPHARFYAQIPAFIGNLLNILLFESTAVSLISFLSNALLPLVAGFPTMYESAVAAWLSNKRLAGFRAEEKSAVYSQFVIFGNKFQNAETTQTLRSKGVIGRKTMNLFRSELRGFVETLKSHLTTK